eukprot:SAG11_NODE_134_length_15338_cov_3.876435_23_plen_73_part_00
MEGQRGKGRARKASVERAERGRPAWKGQSEEGQRTMGIHPRERSCLPHHNLETVSVSHDPMVVVIMLHRTTH